MKELHSFELRGKHHIPKGSTSPTKTLPDLNDMLEWAKTSRYTYNAQKGKYMDLLKPAIRKGLRRWKPSRKVRLHFYFAEPKDGHYRDFDNISAAAHKIVIDAMVKCGYLKDDSPKYLVPSVDKFTYTDEIPYVRVEIEEL